MNSRLLCLASTALALGLVFVEAGPHTANATQISGRATESGDIAPIVKPSIFSNDAGLKGALPDAWETQIGLRSSLPAFEERAFKAIPVALKSLPQDRKLNGLSEKQASLKLDQGDKQIAPLVLPKSRPMKLASLTVPDGMSLKPQPLIKKRHENLPLGRHFSLRKSTLAPMAFVEFCVHNKKMCKSGGATRVMLSKQSLDILSMINREVNMRIRPVNEGKDVWKANVTSGDCEDFALTKKARLMRLGFPAGALRMAVAKTPYGEGHAVLVVSTNRGDFVLDNRNNVVLAFNKTDLRWEKIQGGKNPLLWYTI